MLCYGSPSEGLRCLFFFISSFLFLPFFFSFFIHSFSSFSQPLFISFQVDEKKRQTLKLNGLYQHTVGKKSLRRVVLPMSQPLERLVVKDATETQDKNSNSATPVLRESQFSLYGSASLEYGSRCVRNVLILVSAHDFHGSADEQNALRQSALANGSFIALCCDNPVVALR